MILPSNIGVIAVVVVATKVFTTTSTIYTGIRAVIASFTNTTTTTTTSSVHKQTSQSNRHQSARLSRSQHQHWYLLLELLLLSTDDAAQRKRSAVWRVLDLEWTQLSPRAHRQLLSWIAAHVVSTQLTVMAIHTKVCLTPTEPRRGCTTVLALVLTATIITIV